MIHLNIGSNLSSKHGNRFENISLAVSLLINSNVKVKKFQIFMKHLLPEHKLTKF